MSSRGRLTAAIACALALTAAAHAGAARTGPVAGKSVVGGVACRTGLAAVDGHRAAR